MKFSTRQPVDGGLPGLTGTARVDRRTPALIRRLKPGDVAVIDHLDLDRANAEALVDAGVSAVVNASPFISGRYPNLGPDLLARSGVAMLDNVGADVFGRVSDGASVRLHEGELLVGDEVVATGTRLGTDDVRTLMDQARSGLSTQLQSFTHNTTEFLRREQDLLLHGQGAPTLRARIDGRPVVIVVADYDYKQDLRRLRRYIREQRPILLGVDGGADALLAAGHRPDVVVVGEAGLAATGAPGENTHGVSDKALRSAREVVLHADRSGRALGADRLDRLGVRSQTLAASGTSADVAMLLADVSGASLLIAVGTHATLDEFLDAQRS
ncbi:MAG: putative cytokinetic ring protein SteA, partial [Nocardioides sp.]